MFGVNNNTNNGYVSQVPQTFGSPNNQTQVPQNQTNAQVNPFQGGDKYSIDSTSQAFDQAMARLTGKNVFTNQTQTTPQINTQQTNSPQLPVGVTQSDMNWALSLEDKVKGGYTPTAQENQVYQNIAAKLSEAMNNPTAQTQNTQQPSVQATANMGVTQQELDWALALEAQVKQGYAPNAQETQAYQNIAAKMNAAKNAQTAPTTQSNPQTQNAGASQEEINWALALEAKVKTGYTPNAQETQAYQNIAAKMASKNAQTFPTTQSNPQTQATNLPAGVTQQEIDWALGLESKVKGGYTPTAQETQAYQALAQKISTANSQQPSTTKAKPVTQQEIDWALGLESKVKGGYTPTPQETANYQDLANRLQTQQQSSGTPNASAQGNNRDWSAWSQPFTVPKSLFETTPRIIQVPATLRSSAPSLPTYTSVNVGPDLNAGKTANVPRTLPTTGTANKPVATNTGTVSKQEVDWALGLEAKVKGGYNPNESELYQYKNIADRLQASQGSTTTAPATNTNQPTQGATSLGQRLSNAWGALTK